MSARASKDMPRDYSGGRRHLASLVLLFMLVGCATPGVYPRGPRIEAPKFDGHTFVMSDGARLPARVWTAVNAKGEEIQPHAILIGVHGMNDYSGAFDMPARFLAHDGIATYAFDQRCFGAAPHRGKWSGTRTMVQDLGEVSALVRAENPGVPVYLVGLSMGSAVILAAAGRNELPHADGVILVAPAVWGWSEMNIFYRFTLWLSAHTFPDKKLSGENLSTEPSDNVEMLKALDSDPLMMKDSSIGAIYGLVTLMNRGYHGAALLSIPALVLYGKKDQLVPAAAVHDMANRIPSQKRFLVYTYGYHMLERDYQADIVLRDIETWIGNRATPMASVGVPPDHPWEEEVTFSPAATATASQSSSRNASITRRCCFPGTQLCQKCRVEP